jgi:putative transposase
MRDLGQRYVQAVNRKLDRTGPLWEGRFKSGLVQSESYVLACYRYIELNPVRAGMVTHPRDYAWSSYRSNGDGTASSLLTPHEEYVALGRCHDERLGVYRSLFSLAMDMHDLMEIRSALKGGFAFGNERFKKQMTAMLGRRVQPGQSGRPKRLRHAAGNRGLSPDFLR